MFFQYTEGDLKIDTGSDQDRPSHSTPLLSHLYL